MSVVILLMKVRVNSSVLDWFARHTFSFFILQRIPMLLLSHFGLNSNRDFFVIVSFFATVFLAVSFDSAMAAVDRLLFGGKIGRKAAAD